jgi:hypothetical protein
MEKTKEFIDSMMSGEKTTSDSLFSNLIRDKVRTVLDIKKVELSANIYNASQPQSEA